MIEIYAITIPPGAGKADFDGLLPLLTPEKRRRIARMLRDDSVLQTLYGELLARMAIALRQQSSLRAIRLHRGIGGKPEVAGGGAHFNVAHSLDRVVCAISDMPIGVDVETVRPIEPDIAGRFFAAGECADILSVPESERSRRFFQIWTLKESYLKAVGAGLGMPLNSFAMEIQGDKITIRAAGSDAAAYGFRSWLWDDAYWIGVCALERPLPSAFTVIPHDELRHALSSLDSDVPFRIMRTTLVTKSDFNHETH